MKLSSQLLVCVAMVFPPLAATAGNVPDGFGLEIGRGSDSTEEVRIHAKWKWDTKWFADGAWHLTGYWEASLGRWQGDGDGSETLWDAGITPVFRVQPNGGSSGFYLEGAVGAHWLSASRINSHRDFGSHFNFGDHVGFGATFGAKGGYDLGYRWQHLSNADIKMPNNGIDFHQVRLTYNY